MLADAQNTLELTKRPDGSRSPLERQPPLFLSAREATERLKAVSPWAGDPLPPEQDAAEWEGIEAPSTVDYAAFVAAWTGATEPAPIKEGSENIADFMVALWTNGALLGFMDDDNGRLVQVDPAALGKHAVFDRLVMGLPVTLPTEENSDPNSPFKHHGYPVTRTGHVRFFAKDVWTAWNDIEQEAEPAQSDEKDDKGGRQGGRPKAHDRLTGIGMRLLQGWSGDVMQKWIDASVEEYGGGIDQKTARLYLAPLWHGARADRQFRSARPHGPKAVSSARA